eukprot:Polyplicarium_translucidae@DN2707_c0_g1_i1.p1
MENPIDDTKPQCVAPELCIGHRFEPQRRTYGTNDCILYAVAVGAQVDSPDKRFLYEGHDRFQVLPSFASTLPRMPDLLDGIARCPGIPRYNPMHLLHGEQEVVLVGGRALAPEGSVVCKPEVIGVQDKKSGALLVIEIRVEDSDSEDLLCINRISVFIRGLGGFDPERKQKPVDRLLGIAKGVDRDPDFVWRHSTTREAAALYRLVGDSNPLHIDDELARSGGLEAPPLHGLCTLGTADVAVAKLVLGGDTDRVRGVNARFTSVVTCGDKLRVDIWREPDGIFFTVHDETTNQNCLALGSLELA